MRKPIATMGPTLAAMEWILGTLKWQGESLVDTFHVCYTKGTPGLDWSLSANRSIGIYRTSLVRLDLLMKPARSF
jgi:hypothetical protein